MKKFFRLIPVYLFTISVLISCGSGAASGNSVNLTAEEKSWLSENRDKLVMYFDWKFPPLEYFEAGGFRGLGADVFSSLEGRLGYGFRKVVSRDWVKQLEELESGDVPVVPVIVSTAERQKYAFFTKPYAVVPVVIITARSVQGSLTMNDLTGKRVAVVNEYATEKYVRDKSAGRFEVVEVNNVQEGLRDVSFGVVDALVDNLAVISYYTGIEGISNLRVAGSTDFSFEFSIAVSRKYPLLFSALNKAFESIPENEFEDLYRRWIRLPGLFNRQTVLVIKLAVFFAFLLLSILSIITFVLKKNLNEKILNLRKADELLRKSESLSKAVLDQSYQLFALLDPDGRILILNRTAMEFSGLGENSLIGKFFWDGPWWRIMNNPGSYIKSCIERASKGIYTRDEIIQPDKNGEERVMDFSFSPFVDERGRVSYFIAEARDITEYRKIEQEKDRLREQLVQARKMDAIGQLAGGIAHDFNNMLGAIMGASELIIECCGENEKISGYAGMILSAAEKASLLTSKLLAFSRKGKTEAKPVDMHRILDETVAILERSIDRRIVIRIVKQAEKSIVTGDPAQLQSILMNIGLNARDAMPDGGEMVFTTSIAALDSAACSKSQFPLTPGEYLRISVSDTGSGIKREILDKIFDPFFTTKEVGKGTGLGLSAVYGNVCEHNGAVSVSSEPGRGSVFTVDLPLSGIAVAPVSEPVRKKAGKTAEGRTVLLIDDEDLMRKTAAMILKDLGYNVIEAGSGAEGIASFRDNHETLYAVICDMIMPELSGTDTIRAIRDMDSSVPVIICSGFRNESFNELSQAGIADAFLHKPFRRADMGAVLEKAGKNS